MSSSDDEMYGRLNYPVSAIIMNYNNALQRRNDSTDANHDEVEVKRGMDDLTEKFSRSLSARNDDGRSELQKRDERIIELNSNIENLQDELEDANDACTEMQEAMPKIIELTSSVQRLKDDLKCERDLRLALQWPMKSKLLIDRFEEKYGVDMKLTPQEEAELKDKNRSVDLGVIERKRNWEYILGLTDQLEIKSLVDKLSSRVPAISPLEFAHSIAFTRKNLSKFIELHLTFMVQCEGPLPPTTLSVSRPYVTKLEEDCINILNSI